MDEKLHQMAGNLGKQGNIQYTNICVCLCVCGFYLCVHVCACRSVLIALSVKM